MRISQRCGAIWRWHDSTSKTNKMRRWNTWKRHLHLTQPIRAFSWNWINFIVVCNVRMISVYNTFKNILNLSQNVMTCCWRKSPCSTNWDIMRKPCVNWMLINSIRGKEVKERCPLNIRFVVWNWQSNICTIHRELMKPFVC